MKIQHFFHEDTSTLTYVVSDPVAAVGIVIDPVRDYDPANARTSHDSAEAVARYIDGEGLKIPYVVDTHAHADHLTALPFFAERYGADEIGLDLYNGRIEILCDETLRPYDPAADVDAPVQEAFRDFYNLGADFTTDGSQFDILLDEGEQLEFGSLRLEALHTPGHTPAHMSWKVGDAVFVGDTLFMPDYGTARCDFPGGSAETLYDSIQRLYAMPDETRLFMCHDYRPGGRPYRFETTVAEQKKSNVQLDQSTTRADYVAFRNQRDSDLAAPKLILPSIQVNIRAGALPEPEDNGTAYLKIPLNRLGRSASK